MLTLDIALFRAQVTAFANASIYTDALVTVNWDLATCYISSSNIGALRGSCRQYAINLMIGHLFYLSDLIASGAPTGVVTSASEGTVSISLTPPDSKSSFQFWLNQSPYGQQVLALLKMKGAVGVYVGGYPVAGDFRDPRGSFG